jgi:hypothetical protein
MPLVAERRWTAFARSRRRNGRWLISTPFRLLDASFLLPSPRHRSLAGGAPDFSELFFVLRFLLIIVKANRDGMEEYWGQSMEVS